jgi:hypothetical protein
MPLWSEIRRGTSDLYLTTHLADAIRYAYDAAASDEETALEEGRTIAPEPVVLVVRLADLKGLTFLPDEASVRSGHTSRETWAATARATGAFRVRGDIGRYKSYFAVRRSPRDLVHSRKNPRQR